MAQKNRIKKFGAIYNVGLSISHGDKIFKDKASLELFLSFLEKAKKKFDISIYMFCVMPEHVHLIIQTHGETDISKVMQWLLCNFTKAWNKMRGRKGNFWKARFFSRIIEDETELLKIFDYIAQNPVRAGLAKKAADWKPGGLWHFIHEKRNILSTPPNIERLYKAYLAGGEHFDLQLLTHLTQ